MDRYGFIDDFNILMFRQMDLETPSPFPFLTLRDVEPVYGATYYKLRTAYLLVRNSGNLPSVLYRLLEKFINRELRTVKTYHKQLEYKLTFLRNLTTGKGSIGPNTFKGCWFTLISRGGLANHNRTHQNIISSENPRPQLHSALLARLFMENQNFLSKQDIHVQSFLNSL